MRPQLEWIASQKEEMVKLVEKWANINSGSGNLAGLAQMHTVLHKAFKVLGGEMDAVPLPPSIRINSRGHAVEVEHGHALHIRKHPKAPIQVFLGGHMDTVYPETDSFQTTTRIDANMLRGPGVADMKGGLVIMLKALEALEQSNWAGKIGWEVVINPDEEVGSTGSETLLTECARRNTVGLIFEPSFPDGSIVSSRKGSANFTVVARGRAAHAGRDFHEGRNAISALARFIADAESINDKEKGITLNVGHIEGGGAVNVVPDHAICRINVRMVEPKDLLLIREELNRLINKHQTEGIILNLYESSARPPKPFDYKNQALFSALHACAEELDQTLTTKPSGGVCDGNILSAEGLPTIDSLGAIGSNIHTSEECIQIDSLVSRASLVAYFMMKVANEDIDLTDLREKPHE